MTSNRIEQPLISATAVVSIIGAPFDCCVVPAGDFIYGDDDMRGYREHAPSEDRQTLTLTSFAIAKYPMTYAQFQVFVDDVDGFKHARWWQGFAKDQSQPARRCVFLTRQRCPIVSQVFV